MIITLCGSISLIDKIVEIENLLVERGHTVYKPTVGQINDDTSANRHKLNQNHLRKIIDSDAILVVNFLKNGIDNYIGAATFLEMGWAFALEKKIFILNDIPDQTNSFEIKGMLPVVLNSHIENIR